jgi:hypothetical protein
MFEVAMNLAKTEAKSIQGEAEQMHRDVQVMQAMVRDKEQELGALKIELAGLKSSFKQISHEEEAAVPVGLAEHMSHSHRAPPRASPPKFRPQLADSEHWMHGATIALASLPSPSPRKSETYVAAEPVGHHPASTRVFGAPINGNVNRKSAGMKHEQQHQYQFGAWPLQRQQQQQQQQQQQPDGDRNDHAVAWTSGGYSDAAAKKSRQQGSSSRGKLVFLR